jgi:predicted amidohydrolase YtcJ
MVYSSSEVKGIAMKSGGQFRFGTLPSEPGVGFGAEFVAYTAWGSRKMFLENKIGSLEVGKKADIAIWDGDLYAIPIDEVKNLKCLMTLFAGEVVYSSPDSSVITPAH